MTRDGRGGPTTEVSRRRPCRSDAPATTRAAAAVAGGLLALVLLATSCSTGQARSSGTGDTVPGLTIEAVSTRADAVTGGDVLIGVDGVPSGTDPVLSVDGVERAGALAPVEGDGWTGLVGALPEGEATIEVTAGDRSGQLEVANHPVNGPVFSGPHQAPFACTTEANGLGPPQDADCSAPTQVRYEYVDTAGAVRPLADLTTIPDDVASAEVGGTTVPLVLRTESGVINRAVYWITVLDPTPMSDAWEGESDGWNGDLVYRFGGGCGTSFSQGRAAVGRDDARPTVDLDLLTRGYAVATSTLNTFQVACNDVLSAETALMVKEHFSEQYGPPRHTIGDGASGGSIQQFLIAQNYPGILDAVSVAAPFPDAMSIAPGVTDCGLLGNFYAGPDGAGWTPEQQVAVNGHASAGTCGTWRGSFLETLDPTRGCDLPPEQVYDPVTNPTGARCTLQDSNVNQIGRDPATGFARRPIDNVGVQYGLSALQDGVISVDQFLTLNERIGGFDIDGNIVPERERASEADLRHLYETGRIAQGGGDLGRIPMIAVTAYSDPTGDIHDRWRIFSLRERLADDDGTASPALSIWSTPGGSLGAALQGGATETRNQAIDALAAWLANLDQQGGGAEDDATRAMTLESTRPASAVDRCVLPDGTEITGPDVYRGDNDCTAAYPLAGDPRRAAGGGLDGLTGKCRLEAVDLDSYGVPFGADQAGRLRAVFPDGVCDWSRPGVGQAPVRDTWLRYDGK